MNQQKFIGAVTVGERGQIVIPAAVRERLSISQGEKLLVFQLKDDFIMLAKSASIEQFVQHMEHRLSELQDAIVAGDTHGK